MPAHVGTHMTWCNLPVSPSSQSEQNITSRSHKQQTRTPHTHTITSSPNLPSQCMFIIFPSLSRAPALSLFISVSLFILFMVTILNMHIFLRFTFVYRTTAMDANCCTAQHFQANSTAAASLLVCRIPYFFRVQFAVIYYAVYTIDCNCVHSLYIHIICMCVRVCECVCLIY